MECGYVLDYEDKKEAVAFTFEQTGPLFLRNHHYSRSKQLPPCISSATDL
jgi:hypothetical protein